MYDSLFPIPSVSSNPSASSPQQRDQFMGEAVVDEPIMPHRSGRVEFQGSWWPARCPQEITLAEGQICYVIGIEIITLIVKPAPF